MKLRIGFVSNSSSSSYLLVTTVKVSDKAKEGLTADEMAALDEVLVSEKFLGIDTVQYQNEDNYGDEYIWDKSIDSYESDPDVIASATNKWVKRVKEIASDNEIYEYMSQFVCDDCGGIFDIEEAYREMTRGGVVICPTCYMLRKRLQIRGC